MHPTTAPDRTTPPQPTEYAPYYGTYVALVEEGDIVAALETRRDRTLSLLGGFSEQRGDYRYEPGKWNVKEVVGHINDAERVFAYRALRIARGDQTPLPSFDQDAFVVQSPAARMRISDLSAEFDHIRRATCSLFRQLDAAAWSRRGVASDKEITVRALAWIIAGHELHHTAILRDRYLR